MIRRLLALLSCFVMIFTIFSGAVSAQSVDNPAKVLMSPFYSDGVSCEALQEDSQQSTGDVYVLGDSIIDWFANASSDKAEQYGVEPELLTKKLAENRWRSTINALGGRQLSGAHYVSPSGLDQLSTDTQAVTDADVIVIALGTNREDPWLENTKETFRANVKKVVADIKTINKNKENAKINWVNFAYVGDTLTTDDPGSYPYAQSFEDYNAVLSEEASASGFQVIDWRGIVADNNSLISTAYGSLDGYAHVHPSAEGAAEYASMITDAVGLPPANSAAASQSTVPTSGFSPDPAAVEKYDNDLKPKIMELMPLYQEAARQEGMPDWEILPALHHLEFGLRRDNPTTNTGFKSPYQMGGSYLPAIAGVSGSDPIFTPGKVLNDEEFVTVSRYALKFLKDNARMLKLGDLSQPITAEIAGKLVASYKSGAGSVWFTGRADFNLHAYAWAGYDTTPAHKLPMPWGPGSPYGDEQPGDLVNKPGAATLFMLLKGGAFGSGAPASAGCGNTSTNGAIVNAEGYAFPMAPATKSGLAHLPCNNATCHHDGTPAFDFFVKNAPTEGAAVFAITDGKVDYVKDGYKGKPGCFSIGFTSSKDSFKYAYLHISSPLVTAGQTVSAGMQLAQVGPRPCTGNGSDPHLHFDRGCIREGVHRPGGSDGCRDPDLIPLINTIYEGLPE